MMMRTPPRENRYFFLLELIRMPTSLEKLRSVGHGACAKSTLSVSEKIKKYGKDKKYILLDMDPIRSL